MRPAEADQSASFSCQMMKNFKDFDESCDVPSSARWNVPPPKNSMAWNDLRSGLISSSERVKSVNLPPTIARMMAEDARSRSFVAMKKPDDAKIQWVVNGKAKPLMSLNLPPPPAPTVSFFNPQSVEQTKGNCLRTMGEEKILSVLTQVNVIARKIAEVMGTTVLARIERRKSDNAMCLFTYFKDFPWSVVGGGAVIEEEFVDKPPPPYKIYESWRSQLFQSLQAFFPPPLLSKLKRNINQNVNMEWNMRLIESGDFREILKRITGLKKYFERLWTTDPTDFDFRDIELVTMRSSIIKQIETEVKTFWTYEKIGCHLKMNP